MRFELFRSNTNIWFWRLQAENGRSAAVGGEGYHNREDALASLNNLRSSASLFPVYQEEADGTWRAI